MNYNVNPKRLFILCLFCWFIINLLQAFFTEIYPDEAYYLLYGKYLSWGYFDHPPMVALFTHGSSILFTGNLGVRFLTVIFQIATLVIIWLQLNESSFSKKRVTYFFIISASMVMFSAYGFITTPDSPLLFFTALLLYGYKAFIHKPNKLFTFMLALAMAGIIYSKYHGFLVISLLVLSNPGLLFQKKFYLAVFGAFLLFTPHIWWQYTNDFPSLKYHLVERRDGFNWMHILEYLPNQLLVFNPFTLGAVIYLLYKYKPADLFERALYFIIIGFPSFFLIMTFVGNVEPHWTVAASIPMIILLSNKLLVDQRLFLYVRRFVAPSLVLVLAIRIILTTTILPNSFDLSGKLHHYTSIEKIALNKPVVFIGSFQNPSLYSFSTGKPATVISSLESRRTQFDLWQFEQDWMNQPVFICGTWDGKSIQYKIGSNGNVGFFADSLQTANRLKISFTIDQHIISIGDSIAINFSILNPTKYTINFDHSSFPIELCPVFLKGKKIYKAHGTLLQKITLLKASEQLNTQIQFDIPNLPKGEYLLGISCNTLFGPAANSNFEKVTLN